MYEARLEQTKSEVYIQETDIGFMINHGIGKPKVIEGIEDVVRYCVKRYPEGLYLLVGSYEVYNGFWNALELVE